MKRRILWLLTALLALSMSIPYPACAEPADRFTAEVRAASSETEINREIIWNRLIARGLSKAGAAGVIGNLEWESSCLPNNLENAANLRAGITDAAFTEAVDSGAIDRAEFIASSRFGVYGNGTYGYGLAQWTYPSRKAGLYDYSRGRGCSIADLNMQLDYMWQEMSASLKYDMMTATDYAAACVEFHNVFEGSADDASRIAGRVSLAKAVFDAHAQRTCTLRYDPNGGTGAPEDQSAIQGTALTLSDAVPTREGYAFLGWAESANATEAAYQPGGLFTPDADTTLYAVWLAPDLVLPAALTEIEEEAFEGGAFVYAKLPETVTTIGARAFADCPRLAYIYIPDATITIARDAFSGVTGLTIFGADGSYAEFFANKNGFAFAAVDWED